MGDIYDITDLEMLARDCLTRAGVSRDVASCVARDVALAEVSGQIDSGFEALLRDIRLTRYGRLHPDAVPVVRRMATTILRVDAQHGFATCALAKGLSALADTTRAEGMAMVHLTRASDPGAMVATLSALAGQGLAALAAHGGGQVYAIRPDTAHVMAVGGSAPSMLSALLSLAPVAEDSPLGGPVDHCAWLVALDPAASAAAELLACLPVSAAPEAPGRIALAPDLLAQIVNA